MRDLNFGLRKLCKHNQDGGYQTRADRERMLMLIADQLHALGFRQMRPQSLKPRHVDALLDPWRVQGLANGTLKQAPGLAMVGGERRREKT